MRTSRLSIRAAVRALAFTAMLLAIFVAGDAWGQVFIEDFTTTTYRDDAATTALWDIANGEIKHPPFHMSLLGEELLPTPPLDIVLSGSYAYVALEIDGIGVIDITDPTSLSLVTLLPLSDPVQSLAITGDIMYAGTLAGANAVVLDISDPIAPSPVGYFSGPAIYHDMVVAGNVLYTAAEEAGVSIFAGLILWDISNPANPSMLMQAASSDCFGVAVDGNYAFGAFGVSGLASFDVSDPASPLPISQYGTDVSGDVVVDGTHAFVAADVSGFWIVDISDPGNMTLTGSATYGTGSVRDIAVSGDHAYVGNNEVGVLCYDVSDLSNPVPVDTYPLGSCYGIEAAGNVIYTIDSAASSFQALEAASRVRPPVLAGSYDTPVLAYNVTLHGDLAYVADEIGGVQILDISDPGNLSLVGTYDTGGQVYDAEVDGDYAYVASGNLGLRVLDISDPANPAEVAGTNVGMSDAYGVDVAGNYAYIADSGTGCVAVDIANPTSPLPVGFAPTAGDPRDVVVRGDYAYLANGAGGLAIVDITDTAVMTVVGSEGTASNATGIDVSGNLACLADFDYGLRVYDVSDPIAPTEIGSMPTPTGNAYGVVIAGTRAFVSDWAGVIVVDISEPTSPIGYDRVGVAGPSAGLAYAGDWVFVAMMNEGVQALQVFDRDFNVEDRIAESTTINDPWGEVQRVRLRTVETGNLLWSVSANGGADWTYVTPGGGWTDIPPGEREVQLRWRADLYYSTYGVRSTCDSLILEFEYADDDNDGVPNGIDNCPAENASYFDRDGNGCVDELSGGRHVEYWREGSTLTYVINEDGSANINDGSDFAAVQAGIAEWNGVAYGDIDASYAGTTTQDTAAVLDLVNLVTFTDLEYDFGSHVLAVGVATSFTEPTWFNGRLYRPGEIVDADMIFNPVKSFKTDTQGLGTDLRSVVVHEAGHLFGLSHTPVRTSTMFYALPPGIEARTLERDDMTAFVAAYPSPGLFTAGPVLFGTVRDGVTDDPVPGALVYAVEVATGDTAGCAVTTPLGEYAFGNLPRTDYYMSIHPINETSPVYYMKPSYFNWLVDSLAVTQFVPEFWDDAESATDDPQYKTPVSMANEYEVVDFITNVDLEKPLVTAHTPGAGDLDVSIEAPVVVRFSESIDHTTVQGNFRVINDATGMGVGGLAHIMDDDSVVSFKPFTPWDYATSHTCSVKTGIKDDYGNPLEGPYVFSFTTEAAPPLSISSVVPVQGVPGSVILINGFGFDVLNFSNNFVRFEHVNGVDTISVQSTFATPTQLAVTVPANAATGNIDVRVPPYTSNALPFTVLAPSETPRGYEVGTVALGSLPRSLALSPGGGEAFVATSSGVSVVGVDPGSAAFRVHTPITIAGGTEGIALTPDGNWAYAVSGATEELHVIDTANRSVVATLDVDAEPRGVIVEPSGHRVLVPTGDGEIQVWDVRSGSPNFRKKIGAIASPDLNLRGKMAIDPAGDRLFTLTGTGNLLSFDLGPDTFLVSVPVGPDPRDVAVAPTGQYLYVSDATGLVSVVLAAGMLKVTDITTSGSLRGIDISPTGLYLYAANRELNLLDAVDLNDQSPHFRKVATTIPLGINPVDVDLTPDGGYAVSIVESDQQVVVTSIGVGPILTSLSRRTGPVGTQLILAGSGFGANVDSLQVEFPTTGGFIGATPQRASDTALAVQVPALATSGSVRVRRDRGTHEEASNALHFDVLTVPPSSRTLRQAGLIADATYDYTDALVISPGGDQLIVGTEDGELALFDVDPNSPEFHKLQVVTTLGAVPVNRVVVTPDGKSAYASTSDPLSVYEVDINPASLFFGAVVDSAYLTTFFPGEIITELAVSPDGGTLLAYNPAYGTIAFVDIVPGSPTENEVVGSAAGIVDSQDIKYHPGGEYVYCAAGNDTTVYVIDMIPTSPTFGQVVAEPNIDGVVPLSLSFTPDGGRCYVLARHPFTNNPYVNELDTSIPSAPVSVASGVVGTSTEPYWMDGQRIHVSPAGGDVILNARSDGFMNIDITIPSYPPNAVFTTAGFLAGMDHSFTPDDMRVYTVGTVNDSIVVFDFTEAQSMYMLSGDGQMGVVGQPLAAPLRVKVTMAGGAAAQGVAVRFSAAVGGGLFAGTNTNLQTVATDASGVAQASLILGPFPGSNLVTAGATGLSGSPVTFDATAQVDPNTLPLALADITPADSATGVGVTTTILASFSRSVDVTTVSPSTFFFHLEGNPTPLAATFGFTDNERKVSLTPQASLAYNTSYTIEVTGAVEDLSGNPLENPDSFLFTTAMPPPPSLSSVSPPSATATVTVTLSGSGFDGDHLQNTVLFNDIQAMPVGGDVDFLNVKVPPNAQSGDVAVVAHGDTSNTLPFTVLVPSNTTADEVIASVKTGTSTKTVTMSPDGSMAFAVSPSGNVVVPIDVNTLQSLPPIPVGDFPVAIAMHPSGKYAYVANLNSKDVSIIDTYPPSPGYLTVDTTIAVTDKPLDIAASPVGDRVYVANASTDYSKALDVIDANEQSVNHHTVIASVNTLRLTKAVTVSPDGSRLYIGTDDGYVVLRASDYSYAVIASVQNGTGTKTVTISPDGTLLFLLTTQGEVIIYYVEPGSDEENSVIASVKQGTGTKTVTVSPDGSLLYLIQEESDLILVLEIEVLGSVSVIEPPIPTINVILTVIDSIYAGEDPEMIVFDPSGSGRAIVTNSGPQTVTFLDAVVICMEVPPDTTFAAYTDVPCYYLNGFKIINCTDGYLTYDYQLTEEGPARFAMAQDPIRLSGTTPTLSPGESYAPPPAIIYIPAIRTNDQQLIMYRVTGVENPSLEKTDTTTITFVAPVSVAVTAFEASAVPAGIKLKWDVAADERYEGFLLYRGETGGEDSQSDIVLGDGGLLDVDDRDYVDDSVQPGREYRYTLAVVREDGSETRSRTVNVRARPLELALFQNYPNPFNPTTTIAFTVPDKTRVALTVYNVEGRRVTTLVDRIMTAGYKKVVWDGLNDTGNQVSSGIYFYRLTAGQKTLTRKMVLIR
jgi:hypothetical protein